MSTILYTGRISQSRRNFRVASAVRSVRIAIFSSPKPRRFACHIRCGLRVSERRRCSIFAMRLKARVNHGSMPVIRDTSSGAMPRRIAAIRDHSRSSVASIGMFKGEPFSLQFESSQRIERFVISSDRTAFWNAASKDRSIAMTSPVAFI